MNAPFPEPYLEFVARFNRGEFWESHEVLEVPWRENRSRFYKGLILLASALVHLQRGNARGVRAQLRKTEAHLRDFAPAYLGLDVSEILRRVERMRAQLGEDGSALARLTPFPLHPDPALVRGTEPELGEAGRG